MPTEFLFDERFFDERLRQISKDAGLVCCDVEFGSLLRSHRFEWTADNAPNDVCRAALSRRFLVASLTKPIVAMGIMKLVAEGRLSLSERIGDLLPLFHKAEYRRICVRHLLTHTSGFPDMLPDNTLLRNLHAPLSRFLEVTAATGLDFAPGSDCRYSSMGYLILGAIVEELTQTRLSEFLHQTFFEPLQMHDTFLGCRDHQADDFLPTVFPCLLPDWQTAPRTDPAEAWFIAVPSSSHLTDSNRVTPTPDWGWNSRYWRMLGAPWGGLVSTTADLSRYSRMILRGGTTENRATILSAAAVAAAIRDQSSEIVPSLPSSRAWGFGWRRHWSSHQASFGDLLTPDTIGHWGATGTTMWMDPHSQRFAVILTTTPYEDSQTAIQRISNLSASFPV